MEGSIKYETEIVTFVSAGAAVRVVIIIVT